MEPKAVLWDLDGTLLDTEEHHWLAWRETMAADGREISYAEFRASFGQRNDTILRGWFGPDVAESEIERIGNAKEERYRALVRSGGAQLLPGVQDWLDRLSAEGWRQAIASSAPRLNIETILEAVNLTGRFDAIVSAEDVQRGKPDPQVYLTAAARVGVPPQRCVVVEDAAAGVEGAHRAGMRAVGVRGEAAMVRADRGVATLDQLPGDAFECLLNGREG